MGVRITTPDAVALYDSVTGTAFGPIFKDEAEAEDFLVHLDMLARDARTIPPDELLKIYGDFVEAKDISETELRALYGDR